MSVLVFVAKIVDKSGQLGYKNWLVVPKIVFSVKLCHGPAMAAGAEREVC